MNCKHNCGRKAPSLAMDARKFAALPSCCHSSKFAACRSPFWLHTNDCLTSSFALLFGPVHHAALQSDKHSWKSQEISTRKNAKTNFAISHFKFMAPARPKRNTLRLLRNTIGSFCGSMMLLTNFLLHP